MKTLVLIGGTMGIGKTTICKALYQKLDRSVWLDGDWCWMMHPFAVDDENKKMVVDNITYLLNNYIDNSNFDYIVFNWVMHQQEIINILLERLNLEDVRVINISLMADPDALKNRLEMDVKAGLRQEHVIKTSLERLQMYNEMDTIKVDTSLGDVLKVVQKIVSLIERDGSN